MAHELSTPRLAGRAPTTGDVPAIYGSPVVAERLYPDGRPRTAADLAPALEADVAHWRAHGFGRFLWAERDTGEVVVRCGPKLALVAGRPEVDIHWTVRADRHRRGLAAEAADTVVRACFAALGVESVTARARYDNVASQAVAAALGFAYERDVEHLGDPHRLYRRRAP